MCIISRWIVSDLGRQLFNELRNPSIRASIPLLAIHGRGLNHPTGGRLVGSSAHRREALARFKIGIPEGVFHHP
jgi:hypothetical protein